MTARDIRYGRRGGRMVPWHDQEVPALCEVCERPLYARDPARKAHYSCRPEELTRLVQPTLFDQLDAGGRP